MRTPPVEHRFKPGQSGNPNGRPRKIPNIDVLLEDVLGEEKDNVTAAKAILMGLREIATSRNYSPAARIRAAEVLLDRTYGKPRQPVDANVNVLNLDHASDEVKAIVAEYGLLKK